MTLEDFGHAHTLLVKTAAEPPTTSYGLSGQLYLSESGWILLHVPNELVRGAFSALAEPGAELPLRNGKLNAHISVIRPEELEAAGLTAADIKERGKHFRYTLGPLKTVKPTGWPEMSKVWMIQVKAPELKQLRRTYGLTPLPNGSHEFHITVAVRRAGVLRSNSIQRKAASLIHTIGKRAAAAASVGIDRAAARGVLQQLLQAKSESDRRNYARKHAILRQLMRQLPQEFVVDSTQGNFHGITHKPTNFRLHLPRDIVPGTIKQAAYAVRPSQIHGQGTFATRDFAPGERIGVALHFVREGPNGPEYDRSPLGRFVNYQSQGNVGLVRNGQDLDLVALRPIAAGEEMYTQPYDDELKPFGPLVINEGYRNS